ncbi:MAG: FxsA family protein [Proteobacteria bacterium]|nr:FxsA family protein [Pseudomonadota bacterium]MDA1308049.1 FxsA family protein [Pseudomonadota bacterium]
MAILILCLFVGLPVAEILTFIEVGGRIGGLPTIGATIATAAAGAILFRIQGLTTLRRAQESLGHGRMPLAEVLGGLGLLLAAVCLFVPGFVTDVIGFLLFIPPIRILVMAVLLRSVLAKAHVHMSSGSHGDGRGPSNGSTIDGDFQDVSEAGVSEPNSAGDADLERPGLPDYRPDKADRPQDRTKP